MSDFDELSNVFRSEAHERLDELFVALRGQRLEQHDGARLDAARRAAHNLKGAALTVGARPIAGLCDILETELQAQCGSGAAPNAEQMATWLYLVTEIEGIVDQSNIVHIQLDGFSGNSKPGDDELSKGYSSARIPILDFDTALNGTMDLNTGAHRLENVAQRVEQVMRIHERLTEQVQALQALHDDAAGKEGTTSTQPTAGFGSYLENLRKEVRRLGVVCNELAESLAGARQNDSE
jgi:chemotaxis protein histidine kinase CheA